MVSLVLRRMFLLFQTGFRVTHTCHFDITFDKKIPKKYD